MSAPIFKCHSLSIGYQRPLSENISFEIKRGEIAYIRGSNGSGKTTFIKTILNQIKHLNGSFEWNLDEDQISYLPQITNTNSNFSYNIQEILDLFNVEDKFRSLITDSLLEKRWIDTSGGEKQKVMLVTRLSENTKVLILDEPFNHLDKESIEMVRDLIQQLVSNETNPISTFLVSHLEVSFSEDILVRVKL